jgi:putative hemolysin
LRKLLLTELLIILILVLVNGAFSMTEMAVVSARKVRLQQRAEDGDESAHAALMMIESPNRFFSTVQIGITLVGTLAGAFGGASVAAVLQRWLLTVNLPIVQRNAPAIALTLVVLLISYLTLVLGELVPKRLALSNPERISAFMARPMGLLSLLATPFVALLSFSTDLVLRLLRVKQYSDPQVTPEEITVLMEQGEESGVFEEAETDIVEAVFRLGDLRAGALMTPRTEMDWLDVKDRFDENLAFVLESPHTFFPVAEGSLDEILGVLRSKDLLARVADGVEVDFRDVILPAQFVPESMPAFQVLELLRGANGNLALVIDEYGGVLGIVTLFDVLEAMVGGISERGEPVVPEAVQRDDGSWLVEGMMRIDNFKDLFHLDGLPGEDRAGYQTVGGFVMAQIGSVPVTGESFVIDTLRFEVVDMDGMRVDKVLVMRAE